MTPGIDRVVDTLIDVGQAHGKTPAQVAIAGILSHPEISAVINGQIHRKKWKRTSALSAGPCPTTNAPCWMRSPQGLVTADSVRKLRSYEATKHVLRRENELAAETYIN